MAEIRYNNQAGVLGANLTPVSAGTSQAIVGFFTEAPDFEALSGGDTITIVVFVPISGQPNASIYEIDEITAYNPSFPLNATITRGAQDGVNWPPATLDAGVALWACAPTIEDFESGGDVSSVFGRTGAVTAQSGDYNVTEVTGAAPLASPALTGTPTTPDNSALADNEHIANTKYVDSAVAVETSRATGAESTLAGEIAVRAPINSPTFTGTPEAPTASPLTDDTQLATTAYADAAVAVETSRAEGAESTLTTALALKAPLASPALTGNPTAPTQSPGDNTTKIATDAYVGAAVLVETNRAETAEALLAPLASPHLTGVPLAPTASALTNDTQLATTAYADAAVAVETVRAEGAESTLSGEIAGKAPTASPVFTGTPEAPTATPLTDDTQLATTAYADSAVAVEKTRAETAEGLLAPLASPTFTGAPKAPTQSALSDNTDIATTAYADAAVAVETSRAETAEAALLPLAGGTMTGDLILNADPTVSLQAATKNYVDTHSGGTPPFSAIDLSTTHDPTLIGTEGTVELSNCDNTNLVTLADASLLSAGYSVTLKNANPFNPVPGGIGIVPNGAQTIDEVNIGGGAPCSFINPNASLTLVVDETGNWTTLGYSPASGYFQYGAISQAGPIFPSVGGAESISLDPLQGTADQFSATVLIPFLTYGAGQVCTFGGITTIKHAPTIFRPFTLECEIGVTNDDASQAISVLASVTIPAWAAPGDSILNRYTLQSSDFSVEGTPTGSDLSYDAGAGAVVSAAGGSYFIAASAVAIIV